MASLAKKEGDDHRDDHWDHSKHSMREKLRRGMRWYCLTFVSLLVVDHTFPLILLLDSRQTMIWDEMESGLFTFSWGPTKFSCFGWRSKMRFLTFSWSWWWLLFLTSKNRLNDFSFLSPSLFLSCRQSDSSALITLRGNLPYDTDALLLYRNLCFWEPFDCNMFFICLVSHVPSSHSRYKGNLSLILLWVFNLPDSSFTSLHLRQVTRVTKGFYF